MMKIYEEMENRMRGLVRRMKPKSVNDAGEMQTVSGTVLNGEHRSDVEVLQPHGFSSVPGEGSMMVVIAVGGDQGDLVGLPIGSPKGRMGGLKPGESMVYGSAGQRILMKADGSVDIQSATKVTLTSPNFELTGNVKITGNLDVNDGYIKNDGHAVDKTHKHVDSMPGPSVTGIPQ